MRIILLALAVWLCQANKDVKECQGPRLKDGFLVPERESHEHGSTVHYACNSGLKSALDTWWGDIKCENGKWSHIPRCVPVSDCIAPDVPHIKPLETPKVAYPTDSIVAFTCDKGYETKDKLIADALCKNGQWSNLPECIRKQRTCSIPKIPNAVILQPYQDTFDEGDSVQYACKEGYEGEGRSRCEHLQWKPPLECKKSHISEVIETSQATNCEQPTIPNGDVTEQPDGFFVVQCANLHRRYGPRKIRCVNGRWSELPECKAPCKLDQSMIYYTSARKEYLEHGEEESFFCSSTRRVSIKCDNGKAYYNGCGRNDW